uniref:Uncharacterized protein n=1 Tax=Eutreptiella gymnastica TaxID=73025 RepID=A0A7S1NFU6_9EUGL
MGIEGGDLDAADVPKKKRVIKWKPLSEMSYEERRRYELSKVKNAWRVKHLREPQIRECGEQYLEWYENGGPGVEACAYCRFFYPEHKVHWHEQTCPERPVEGPEPEYNFDPTAPVSVLTKQHVEKLSRRGQLESNLRQPPSPGSQQPHSTARGWRTGSRKDPRPLSVQRAEAAARRAQDPYTHDERPVHERMPANRHWIQTVPATIKVLEQVTDFMALDRAKIRHEQLQDQIAKEQYRQEKRCLLERGSKSPPTRSQGSPPSADRPPAKPRQSMEGAKAQIQAQRELMEEADVLQQRPFDPEVSVQAARRKAVLTANQWGDVYYPYSDQPMLDSEVYANMDQRMAALHGMRAALQAQATARQELLRAAQTEVARAEEQSLVRYHAPAPAWTREWGKKGSSDVVGESTYTGAQLIDGIGNNQGYGVAATGGGGDIATVNLQVERTSTSETYYNQQLSVANTTLWTVGKYKYGYTLQSVDTPSLYLMADESGTVTVGQMLLSTPGACWLLRSIPSGGWTFLNSMTMQPLMMSANAMYVTQAQRSSLANPTTGTPTSAQAAAQVSGFAAHTVPAKSDTSTTGLTVTTNVAAQSAPAGDPEVVLYCPCCTAGEFASFPLGTGASPVVATTPASEQFSAGQCYVQSVQPSDLVYAMPPTVTPGTIAVGVKSGATPSSNGSLSMACCYTPAAKTTVPPAGVAQPKASGTSPPTSSR